MPQGKICTLYWYNNDDPSDTLLYTQEVDCQGPPPFDDFSQGSWIIASIGPYYTSPTGPSSPSPLSVLKGPIGAVGQGIPWWWLAGQPGTYPSTPTIQTPSSGASKPFYY